MNQQPLLHTGELVGFLSWWPMVPTIQGPQQEEGQNGAGGGLGGQAEPWDLIKQEGQL